jgi:hypothetical protein
VSVVAAEVTFVLLTVIIVILVVCSIVKSWQENTVRARRQVK